KRVGVGGVLIMEVNQGTPKGSARIMSKPWRELFTHATREADRLGLVINMNNDAGWCGSGGPWITPDLAMQKLTISETKVTGPKHFEGILAKPKAENDYYKDIVVLAAPDTPGRIDNINDKGA